MKLTMLKDRGHDVHQAAPQHGPPNRLTSIGSATPLGPATPDWREPRGTLTPIVRLPVVPTRAPSASPPPAVADLRIKRFRGDAVEHERYEVTLLANSTAPVALLAALSDAARQLDDLAQDQSADDLLLLTITIRREQSNG